jgi:hypothetical protein
LAVGYFIQGHNDGGVTTARIIEEETGYLLDAFDAEFVKKGR